jgi:hypothetical protein
MADDEVREGTETRIREEDWETDGGAGSAGRSPVELLDSSRGR